MTRSIPLAVTSRLAVLLVAAYMLIPPSTTSAQTLPSPQLTVQFPHPDRIRYDAHSLILDNKPTFIYSGAFHYFRCPKELWKDRLLRMKDAGLNCVETYLAWNYHEPDEPANLQDFSKLQHMDDLNDFIQLARDTGLYVIIRPGPYICAEWDRGGLPEWLLNFKPANFRATGGGGGFLRSANPAILQWDKHWLDAAAKIVKPHLVTNLPPNTPGVIGWQIENEYNLSDILPEEQAAVLKALTNDSLAAGIDIPLFTCRTKTANFDPYLQSQLYDSLTCYPKYDTSILVDRIANIAEPQPQKFKAAMELQAGWFSQNGGRLSEEMGFSAAHLNQLGLTSIEQGCTLINWYMFYGGSQFGYGAAQNMTQSYDYDAPIRESGGVGPRFLAAKAIGLMLKDHGTNLIHSNLVPLTIKDIIAESVTPPPQPTTFQFHPTDVHITLRRSDDGSQYFFFRTDSRDQARTGLATLEVEGKPIAIPFDLPPFGASVLYIPPGGSMALGQWLPKPVPALQRPNISPRPLRLKIEQIAPETWDNWHPVKMGQSFASMGINNSRYVAFRSTFTLTEDQLKNPPTLFGRTNGANLIFTINDHLIPPESTHAGLVPLAGFVKPGENRVELLFENNGNDNHYGIDADKSAPELSLIPPAAITPLKDWRIKILPTIISIIGVRPELEPDINILDWNRTSVDNGPNLPAENTTGIFHTTIDLTPDQLKSGLILSLGTLDETGELLINGQRAGGNPTERLQPLSKDITPFLKPGKNAIDILAANTDHQGGLYNGAFLLPKGQPLTNLELSADSHNLATQIRNAPINWIPFNSTTLPTALAFYRTQFATPTPTPGVWLPWRLHLQANLNAQVFLNGHHLGAYNAAGPQQNIWLPECWLNPPGTTNTITLQARPTTTLSPLVTSIELQPDPSLAENR